MKALQKLFLVMLVAGTSVYAQQATRLALQAALDLAEALDLAQEFVNIHILKGRLKGCERLGKEAPFAAASVQVANVPGPAGPGFSEVNDLGFFGAAENGECAGEINHRDFDARVLKARQRQLNRRVSHRAERRPRTAWEGRGHAAFFCRRAR